MKHKPESRFLGVLASSTYTKIGVIQGRLGLARPLPKNDMQLCEVVHIFDVWQETTKFCKAIILQLKINFLKITGRNINNVRYADDTTLMAEREEKLKSLLMKVKEDNSKAGLKLNIQKTKIMASSSITSWQIDGETMEIVTGFIFSYPQSMWMVTAAMKLKDACSLEEKLWQT